MSVDGPRAIMAMIGVEVTAAFATLVLPILLGGMVDRLGLSAREAGMVASAEMSGLFVATVGVMLVVARWNRRWLTLAGLCLMLLGNLAAAAATGFAMLAGARFVAGLGAGVVMATVKACMAATRDPVRIFGILCFVLLLAGAVGLPGMPVVLQAWDMSGAYLLLAALVLPGALLLPWLPAYAVVETKTQSPKARLDIPWVAVGLGGLLCYYLSHGAVTPFLERLGIAASLQAAAVGKVLGTASIGGMAGAALATWLGNRIGRLWPLCVGILCSLVSITLLVYGMQPAIYAIGAVTLMTAALFTVPYLLASLAALDRKGSVLVAGLLMQSMGLAAGPALGGLLIAGADYSRFGWLCFAGYIGSLALFLPLLLRMDRHDGEAVRRAGTAPACQPLPGAETS